MASAAIRPCRLAGPASGTRHNSPVTVSLDLHGIPDGPNTRVAGPHGFIYTNAAVWAEFQTCVFSELGLGFDADREDDYISLNSRAAPGLDRSHAPFASVKAHHSIRETDRDMVVQKVNVHIFSHFAVERRHDLIEHLDDRDLQPPARQIFGHFESDEPAAHNDRIPRLGFLNPRAYGPAVGNGSKRENTLKVNAGKRRPSGHCTRRQDQRVVSLLIDRTLPKVLDLNLPLPAIDAKDLVFGANLDVETSCGIILVWPQAALLHRRWHRRCSRVSRSLQTMGTALFQTRRSLLARQAAAAWRRRKLRLPRHLQSRLFWDSLTQFSSQFDEHVACH